MRRVTIVRTFAIERTWQGELLPPEQQVTLRAVVESEQVQLSWDAPWPSGVLPNEPPGQCWGLWEYSVVELFLASAEGPYVEFEFGPGGHWLALYLTSYRRIAARLDDVQYRWWREGGRWRGEATARLPESHRWGSGNAYFIDGSGEARRYCAASSVHEIAPDFHRRDCYLTL
jgi:hypothetical protein